MKLGRELDEDLGRVGKERMRKKVRGMKENALFIGPSNRVNETTLATQRLTRGDLFGKRDRHDWPTNSFATRGVRKSEILLKSQQCPGRPFEQRGN